MSSVYTLEELKEYITNYVDEVDLIELLDLTSEKIADRFSDEIEDNYEWLIEQLGLDGWEEGIND